MVGEGHLFGLSTLFGLRLSSASASASISEKKKIRTYYWPQNDQFWTVKEWNVWSCNTSSHKLKYALKTCEFYSENSSLHNTILIIILTVQHCVETPETL